MSLVFVSGVGLTAFVSLYADKKPLYSQADFAPEVQRVSTVPLPAVPPHTVTVPIVPQASSFLPLQFPPDLPKQGKLVATYTDTTPDHQSRIVQKFLVDTAPEHAVEPYKRYLQKDGWILDTRSVIYSVTKVAYVFGKKGLTFLVSASFSAGDQMTHVELIVAKKQSE